MSSGPFLKYFFWCDLPLLAVLIIFVLFCHQVVCLIHLVFRWTQELNSRPRTMVQTVSPLRSNQVAPLYLCMNALKRHFDKEIHSTLVCKFWWWAHTKSPADRLVLDFLNNLVIRKTQSATCLSVFEIGELLITRFSTFLRNSCMLFSVQMSMSIEISNVATGNV